MCYQDLTWVPCESNMFAEIELDDRQSDTVRLCKHDNHEAFIEKDRQKWSFALGSLLCVWSRSDSVIELARIGRKGLTML